jgi:hypothetical protein
MTRVAVAARTVVGRVWRMWGAYLGGEWATRACPPRPHTHGFPSHTRRAVNIDRPSVGRPRGWTVGHGYGPAPQ